MLKKAGLVAAVSVASLFAASPLAFAGTTGYDGDGVKGDSVKDDHGHGHHGHGHNQNSEGFVNALNGNNVNVPMQLCNNDVQGQVGAVPIQDVAENPTFGLNGALGLLGGEGKAKQHSDVDNSRTCDGATGGAGYGNN